MPDDPSTHEDETNTTRIMHDMFHKLRSYSQSRKVSEADILRQRARQYAELPPDTAPASDTLTVITFELGTEHYGLDVRYVSSVRPLASYTRVPNTPPHFMGVVNVRGAVVTLLDLSTFFGLHTPTQLREIVVVELDDTTLALPVRRVRDVLIVPRQEITKLDDAPHALGAYVSPSARIIVLDADEIFRDKRLNHEAGKPHDQ